MKKLLIATMIVAASVVANAANVTWGSGVLYTAAGANGGWSNTMVNNAGATVTMEVYLLADATAYSAVSGLSQKELFDWSADKTADYTAQNKNASGGLTMMATASDTGIANADYYSVVIATYTDAKYGDMYMASAQTFKTTSAGAGTANNIFGGMATATAGGIRDWQTVPEPTSGLLLLLGVAGLALRRRRA